MENNIKKDKENFYKTNLKFILEKGFMLRSILTQYDDFGSSYDVYNFHFVSYAGACDINVPMSKMFRLDLSKSDVFVKKLDALIIEAKTGGNNEI